MYSYFQKNYTDMFVAYILENLEGNHQEAHKVPMGTGTFYTILLMAIRAIRSQVPSFLKF